MKIVNQSEKCSGKWTRISTTNPKNEALKLILDLIISNEKCLSSASKMVIDERRENSLEKVTKYKINERDHNTIIANFDFSHKFHERAVTMPKPEYKWVRRENSLEKVTKYKINERDHNTIIANFDFSHKFHERAVTMPKPEYKWVFNDEAQEKF